MMAFATGTTPEAPATMVDEICYTVTVNASVGPVGGGVEVTGCGDTAAEALGELIEGIEGLF